jgi:hypothetical protein
VWQAEETETFEAGTPSRELYQAFTASCLRNNLRRDQIPSETKWGRQLTRLGYPSLPHRPGQAAPAAHLERWLLARDGRPGPSVDATRQTTGQIPTAPIPAVPVTPAG